MTELLRRLTTVRITDRAVSGVLGRDGGDRRSSTWWVGCESGDFFARDRKMDDMEPATCWLSTPRRVRVCHGVQLQRPLRPAKFWWMATFAVVTTRESYEDLVRHEQRHSRGGMPDARRVMADSHDRIPRSRTAPAMSRGKWGSSPCGDYCSRSRSSFRDLNMRWPEFREQRCDREGSSDWCGGVGGELYDSPHSVELEGKRLLIVHEMSEARCTRRAPPRRRARYTHRREVRTRATAHIIPATRAMRWTRVRRSSIWRPWKSSSLN